MRRDENAVPVGQAGMGGQPGSSPRTSLLRPRLAQPWGDLSQAPLGGSLASTRREEAEGEAGSGPLCVRKAAPTLAYVCFPDPTPVGLPRGAFPLRNRKNKIKG